MSDVVNRIISLAHYRANPDNYNEHPDEQIADLRRSVRLFSQVRSVVVWDDGQGGFVGVAGHGFIEAAMAEGKTELRADVIPADWTPEKVVAYMAADNETARGSSPDLARLAALVARLKETDEELAAVAAGGDARLKELLRSLKAPAGEDDGGQVDRAAELQEKWSTATGQLWALGDHRLVCGDCTDAAVVARVMGGERADFFVTDPPYVLQAASDKASKADENDQALRHFLRNCWLAALPHMQPHAGAVWFCNWRTVDCVRTATRTRNEKSYQIAVWYKGKGANPGAPWMNTVEFMLFYCLDGYNHKKTTGMDNFISIPWGGGTRAHHPAEKPVEVYEYAMTPMNAGDLVVDPFLGSGTTLIACQNLGRRARCVEIEPSYVAVCLERFFALTGVAPVLLEAGPAQA